MAKKDTVLKSADSLIVHFLSSTGKLIKEEKKRFRKGEVSDSSVNHNNSRGLLEYSEHWRYSTKAMRSLPDTSEDYLPWLALLSEYERYEYDSLGRVIKKVFHISTPHTIRLTFTYLPDGSRQRHSQYVDDSEFWK